MIDIKNIDNLDPEGVYSAKELIDILRARTFSGYDSVFMIVDGNKYHIRVRIDKEKKEEK